MDASRTSAAPIYDLLIAERGDVVADAARCAAQTRLEAAGKLDFGLQNTSEDDAA
ncbi:hypothetical protein ACFUJY_22720 [Streptomyces sp. NPDC057249]|uniref:hypothetical protein n=1 Tax=Streptomyces sp. NPDC057249 TaxID=3346067 RepID=UPI003627DA03